MSEKPLLSVITVNLNNIEGLKKTMQSVFQQTRQEFEFIIIDGGSTDGSKELIEQNSEKVDYWVSEPDKGIYNAMNKGVLKSKGGFLLFLNSGDWLYEETTLEKACSAFSTKSSIYYGNVVRIYQNDKETIKTYPSQLSFSFFMDSALAHQAVFIERNLFFDLSLYDESYEVLGDWEFLIKAICKYNVKTRYLNLIIANYPMDGISSSFEGRQIMKNERERCYKKHFPYFVKDYESFNHLKNNSKVQLVLKLESNPKLGKINYILMSLLNKLK